MATVVGRLALLRAMNAQAVLDALRTHGPASQAALARRLRLSKSTVSAVAARLLAQGLVRQSPVPRSRVGRRPTLLELNPEAGFVVGIDLGATYIRVATADACGGIRSRIRERTARTSLDALLEQIVRLVGQAAGQAGIRPGKLLAVGIGVPGAVSDGRIRLVPNLPFLEGVPLRSLLVRRLRRSVVMENDVNLAAVGERWRGRAHGTGDFAYIAIGTGLGMGVVLGGAVYRGFRGYAGEIGTIPLPSRNGYVPVESLVTGPAIARRAREYGQELEAEAVFREARAGASWASRIVDEVAGTLAWTIACVNATLDLRLVVLGGGVLADADLLVPRVRSSLAALVPFAPEVVPSALGGEATLLGALATALEVGRAKLEGPRR